MNRKNKVFVVGGDMSVTNLFHSEGWVCVNNVFDSDLVCFTGGADVGPQLYGHPRHTSTFVHDPHDQTEMAIFAESMERSTPMVGICRGGQFLNVMNGGKMYQDVTGHTQSHFMHIVDKKGLRSIQVTSTHHQMMMPSREGVVLGTGPASTVTFWNEEKMDWDKKLLPEGVEVVRYKMALCFQPHPEFSIHNLGFRDMREYFFSQIEELMND